MKLGLIGVGLMLVFIAMGIKALTIPQAVLVALMGVFTVLILKWLNK